MDKIIQHISGAFSEMGPILTFIAVTLIVTLFIFREPLGELLKRIRLKRKAGTVEDLWSHDLFMTSEVVRDRVKAIRFTTHGEYDLIKTKLLKILVNYQLDCFRKNMKEFIKQEGVEKYDGQKLKFLLTKNLRKSIDEHNKLTFDKLIEMGVDQPDVKFLIDEYDFFREEIQKGFVDRIESITTNTNYNSNYDRLSAVFEVLAMGLYLIPKDATTACNSINGRFKKYRLNGNSVYKVSSKKNDK